MENKEIKKPNFVVLRQVEKKGPIFKVTICKETFVILDEVVLNGIPPDWSVDDFYTLLNEGKRFFLDYNKTEPGFNFENHPSIL